MRRSAVLGAAFAVMTGLDLTLMSAGTQAMGFCYCCEANLTHYCGKMCAVARLTSGMCPVIVDYESMGVAAQGINPLNGMSLKELSLGAPTPWQLELFRRFTESGRRKAITSYKSAMRRLKHRQIAQPDFEKADVLYREALVNYYHGIRAYLIRVGTKSD